MNTTTFHMNESLGVGKGNLFLSAIKCIGFFRISILGYPRCQANITFSSIVNWKFGGIRDYYVHRGVKSLVQCQADCAAVDDCYVAQVTNSSNCYFLLSSSPATCKVETQGPFGPAIEKCGLLSPCPTVYKRCGVPNCYLQRMIASYCSTDNDPQAALRCSY